MNTCKFISTNITRVLVIFLFFLTTSLISFAQQPSTGATPTQVPRTNLIKDIIKDQVAIFSKPITIKKRDLKFIVPFTTVTAISLAVDEKVNKNLSMSSSFVKNSKKISELGSGYAMFGTAGAFYIIGRLSGNTRSKETGILGLEALADSSIVVNVVKVVARRQRPTTNFGEGEFFRGGSSFPSGHAILAWSMASVVANKYSDKPIVKFGAYGLATLVSVTRVTGQKHFPTDVLVSSVIGYLIGHYVVKHHNHP